MLVVKQYRAASCSLLLFCVLCRHIRFNTQLSGWCELTMWAVWTGLGAHARDRPSCAPVATWMHALHKGTCHQRHSASLQVTSLVLWFSPCHEVSEYSGAVACWHLAMVRRRNPYTYICDCTASCCVPCWCRYRQCRSCWMRQGCKHPTLCLHLSAYAANPRAWVGPIRLHQWQEASRRTGIQVVSGRRRGATAVGDLWRQGHLGTCVTAIGNTVQPYWVCNQVSYILCMFLSTCWYGLLSHTVYVMGYIMSGFHEASKWLQPHCSATQASFLLLSCALNRVKKAKLNWK